MASLPPLNKRVKTVTNEGEKAEATVALGQRKGEPTFSVSVAWGRGRDELGVF